VRPLAGAVPALRRVKHFLDYATGGLGAVTRVHDGLPYYESRQMLGERLGDLHLEQRLMPLSQAAARKLLGDFLQYQQRTWFVAEFMTKIDGSTMYQGLEARSPFLDHVLWEFAAKLPPALRLRGGTLKAVLREMVRRRVSPVVASRKKQGFSIPVEQWLLGRWKPALERLPESSPLERQGWIRRGALSVSVAEALGKGTVPRQLWFLLVLDHWLRKEEIRAVSSRPPLAMQSR
jgi:asparagine synthase (glutamine-hydrolysing)